MGHDDGGTGAIVCLGTGFGPAARLPAFSAGSADCPDRPARLIDRMPHLPQARAVIFGLAAVIVASLAVVACQSSPTASALTDPREILGAAVTTMAAAKTVRIDGRIDGKVALDLLGSGGATPIELTGTTAKADLDLFSGNARATFSAPGLLGVTGEAIVLDGTSYLRTTLTGTLYQVQPAPSAPAQPSGTVRASILQGLTDLLADPRLQPVKGEDAQCGNTTCYRVDVALSGDGLAALGAGGVRLPSGLPIPIQLPDLTAATVNVTVLVAKDTTRLSDVKAAIDLGVDGTATVELTFSKWDEPVSISAPPPDQLAPGG